MVGGSHEGSKKGEGNVRHISTGKCTHSSLPPFLPLFLLRTAMGMGSDPNCWSCVVRV